MNVSFLDKFFLAIVKIFPPRTSASCKLVLTIDDKFFWLIKPITALLESIRAKVPCFNSPEEKASAWI